MILAFPLSQLLKFHDLCTLLDFGLLDIRRLDFGRLDFERFFLLDN